MIYFINTKSVSFYRFFPFRTQILKNRTSENGSFRKKINFNSNLPGSQMATIKAIGPSLGGVDYVTCRFCNEAKAEYSLKAQNIQNLKLHNSSSNFNNNFYLFYISLHKHSLKNSRLVEKSINRPKIDIFLKHKKSIISIIISLSVYDI